MKAVLAEGVGTSILTLVIALVGSSLAGLTAGMQGLGTGAALLALILAGRSSSGADYNPIVTTALVLLGKMSLGMGLAYFASQVIGGLVGGAMAKILLGPVGVLADPSFTLNPASIFARIFFSFAVVLTVLNAAMSKGGQDTWKHEEHFFAPALAVVVALASTMGICLNPAAAWGIFTAAGKSKGGVASWVLSLLGAFPAMAVFRLADPDEAEMPTEHVSYFPKTLVGKEATRSIGPYVSECVGTFILTAVVTMALATGRVAAPLAAGAMVISLTLSQGHLSGAHFNPAVTIGLFVRKGSKAKDRQRVVGYIVAQILGALMAARMGSLAFGNEVCHGKLLPLPVPGGSEGQAFGAEFLYTSLAIQTVLTLTGRTAPPSLLTPIGVAAVFTASLMASQGLSGGSLNPAIATAMFLVNATGRQMQSLWVYCLAPVLASVVVGLGYRKMVGEEGGVEDAVEGAKKSWEMAVGEAKAAFKSTAVYKEGIKGGEEGE